VTLDASALLAYLQQEPGGDVVRPYIADAAICTVNLSEAMSVLVRKGHPFAEAKLDIEMLNLTVVGFDTDLAFQSGALIARTKQYGLSFGDRACLACAAREGIPVLTAERSWADLDLRIDIQLIR
jgi:PIN domain nuclease of toxin-antitoxin system